MSTCAYGGATIPSTSCFSDGRWCQFAECRLNCTNKNDGWKIGSININKYNKPSITCRLDNMQAHMRVGDTFDGGVKFYLRAKYFY